MADLQAMAAPVEQRAIDAPVPQVEPNRDLDAPKPSNVDTPVVVDRTDFLNQILEGETAGIESYMNGRPVTANIAEPTEYTYNDELSRLMEASEKSSKADQEAVEAEMTLNPGNNADQFNQNLQITDIVNTKLKREAGQYHLQAARALGSTASDFQIDTMAATLEWNEILDVFRKDLSGGDYIQMMAMPMLPGAETTYKAMLTDSLIDPITGWNNMVATWNSKTIEERHRLFPAMANHIFENSPDNVTAVDSLQRMINFQTNDMYLHPLWTAIDVFGAASVLKASMHVTRALFSQMARATKKLNTTKILKNSNRTEEADASAGTLVMSDQDKLLGQTKLERNDNALPFNQHAENTEDAQEALSNHMDLNTKGDIRAPGYVAGVSDGAMKITRATINAEKKQKRDKAIMETATTRGELDPESRKGVYNFNTRVEGVEQAIRDGDLVNKETFIDATSRRNLEDDFAAQIHDDAVENAVVNITDVKRTSTKTIMTYNTRLSDGNMSTEVKTLKLKLSDTGNWGVDFEDGISTIGRWVASPQALAKNKSRLWDDTKAAQRLEQQDPLVRKQFSDLIDDALSGLADKKLKSTGAIGRLVDFKFKASLAKVNEALSAGNLYRNPETGEVGKVFTIKELRDGIWSSELGSSELAPSNMIKNLDNKEIATYYKMRRILDMDWRMRDATLKIEMELKGLGGIKFSVKGAVNDTGQQLYEGINMIGKPYATANEARNAAHEFIATGKTQNFYNSINGEMELFSKKGLDRYYDMGYQIVKANGRVKINEKVGEVDFVMVTNKQVGELPPHVAPYNSGYVANYHEDGVYWIKEEVDAIVNGTKGSRATTPRYFRTKVEANAWIKKQTPERQAKLRMVEDGQLAAFSREQNLIVSDEVNTGSLHFGARADEIPVFGEGTTPHLMPAVQSIARSMGSLSKFVTHNEWMLGAKERWLQTANALTKEHTVIKTFGEGTHNIEDVEIGRFMNHWAQQINMWDGFQPSSHRSFERMFQGVYEWMQGSKYANTPYVTPAIWAAKSFDPIKSAKSVAFHAFLGWFNPIQAFVQGQGSVVALGMNLEGERLGWIPLILKDQNALRIIINDPHAGNLKKIAKIHGMKEKELKLMKDEYLRTGMDDSIRSNADYEAAMQGYSQGADAVRSILDNGLFFYRAGEKMTRRTAWLTAYREMTAVMKSTDSMTDEMKALRAVFKKEGMTDEVRAGVHSRAIDLTLTMGRNNSAAWQKGAFGVTTQFQQISAKALESVTGMNGGFTAHEAAKLSVGQLFAYGATGVPLGGMAMMILQNQMGEEAWNNLPTVAQEAAKGGLVDALSYTAFGIPIEAAKRGALATEVGSLLGGIMQGDETNIYEWLLGPAGQVIGEGTSHLAQAIEMLMIGAPDAGLVDLPVALGAGTIEAISSMDQLDKAALIMRTGEVYSKSGKLLAENLDARHALATALGVQISVVADVYDMKKQLRANIDRTKRYQKMADDRFLKIMQKGPENVSDAEITEYKELVKFIVSLGTDEERVRWVKNRAKRMIADSEYRRVINGAIKFHSSMVADKLNKNAWVIDSKGPTDFTTDTIH